VSLMGEYIINFMWDEEAHVWTAICDELPLALEHGSFDALVEKVKIAAVEMHELNHENVQIPNFLIQAERLVLNG